MPLSAPFRVRSFGCEKNNPRHFTPGTKEGDQMLILNVEGIGHYRNSTGEVQVPPSTAGLIPPEDCGVFYADTDNPYWHYYCRFQGEYAIQLAEQVRTEQGSRFFPVDAIHRLTSCLEQLPYVIRQELPDRMGEYELGLARILVTLTRNQPERDPGGLTGHALRQYIETRLDHLTNLDEMAAHFKMTKPALCRAGKKLLGSTIVQTSNAIRMDYACQLLQSGAMNVTEIARRIGFEDPFYFSRVFKTTLGMSPKKWQQKAIARMQDTG